MILDTRALGALLALTLAACATTTTEPSSPDSVELPEQERVATPAATAAEEYRLPAWTLEDVQPKSARFGERYGLDAYQGRTVVVVLLEGHCPYCQSNSVVAQKLEDEVTKEGLDVQIVVLGDLNASQFASRVSVPIFRDADGSAWETMRAKASKHDTFVFGPDGKRTFFWLGSYQGDATRWHAEVGEAVRAVAKPR